MRLHADRGSLPLMLVLLAACTCTSAQGQGVTGTDWPQWRGANRDGISTETGWRTTWPKGGPRRLWHRKVGTGFAAVSVSGGRVYTTGNDGRNDVVWCLDAEKGSVIWKHAYRCQGGGRGWPGTRIAPLIDGQRLYTLSLKGHLTCLNTETGDVVWSKDTARELGARGGRHGFSCHPLIDGDRIIVELGARGGTVVAFDKNSGKVLWQAGKYTVGHSSPVIHEMAGRRVLIVFTGSALVGMDPKQGRELWQFPCRIKYSCNIATPIVSGNMVFVSSVYLKAGSLLLRAGGRKPTVLWQSKEMQNHCNSCVLWKGCLYGFDGWVNKGKPGEGVLKCIDLRTGRAKWAKRGLGTGSLMLADGKLIILSGRGELVIAAASPDRFRPLAQAKVLTGTCWTMPVLSGGRIYCRNYEGDLVCLDVRK